MYRTCISTYICVMMLTYRYMHTYVMVYVNLCSLYMRHVWHAYPFKTRVYIFIHMILVFKCNMIQNKISLNLQFWFMLYICLSSAQQCACKYYIFVMHCATMSQKCLRGALVLHGVPQTTQHPRPKFYFCVAAPCSANPTEHAARITPGCSVIICVPPLSPPKTHCPYLQTVYHTSVSEIILTSL